GGGARRRRAFACWWLGHTARACGLGNAGGARRRFCALSRAARREAQREHDVGDGERDAGDREHADQEVPRPLGALAPLTEKILQALWHGGRRACNNPTIEIGNFVFSVPML